MDKDLLGSLIGTGASLGGSILGQRQQQAGIKEQGRQFDLSLARKNQLLRLALPGMLTNLGYSSSSIPGMMGDPNQTPQYAAQKPKSSGDGGKGILGILGGLGGSLLPKLLGGGF